MSRSVRNRLKWTAPIVALCAIGSLVASVPARADIIERVIAVVNDDAIFLSDVRARAVPFLPQAMNAATETERVARLEELYRQVLDALIDERLIDQAAAKLQVHVTSEDVDRLIENNQQQNHMTAEQFWAALHEQGYTERQYRSDVRSQLVRLRVLNLRARGRVNISEDDVRARYEQATREARASAVFHASHIFFAYPENATATDVAAVQAQARQVRETLTADTFSDAMTRYGGGDLGELRQGSLPAELETVLLTLSPGQISEPVTSEHGVHIFLLTSREAGSSTVPEYAQVRQQIYRELMETQMARQQQVLLEELRREASITKRLR